MVVVEGLRAGYGVQQRKRWGGGGLWRLVIVGFLGWGGDMLAMDRKKVKERAPKTLPKFSESSRRNHLNSSFWAGSRLILGALIDGFFLSIARHNKSNNDGMCTRRVQEIGDLHLSEGKAQEIKLL